MADFFEECLAGLQSNNHQDQTRAMRLLQGVDTPLSVAQWSRLAEALAQFDETACPPETIRSLIKSMFFQISSGFAAQSATTPARASAAIHAPGSLVHWLFEPLLGKSLMLSIMSTDGLTRDESAVGFMSRLLSWRDFPETTFQKCRILSEDWLNYLWNPEYQAVGFFGRLPLYGPAVAADYDNPSLRFLPSNLQRPKRLRHRQIDPAYHSAYENIAGRQRCTFTTHLEERSSKKRYRVDYGFIQRYVVKPGGNKITVFRIWGPSSLGTEGAALWASANLPKLVGGTSNLPIMMTGDNGIPRRPDGTPNFDADSPFEALLEVKAEETRASWGALAVDLKRLYVGPSAWDKETRSWSNVTPTEIRVRYEDDIPVKISFDGVETSMRSDTEGLRVLAAAIEMAVKNPRREFDIVALANRCDVWNGGQGSEEKARSHINTLKHRYIHTLENRNNQQPRFMCDLVLERFNGSELYPAPDLPAESSPPPAESPRARVARPRKSK